MLANLPSVIRKLDCLVFDAKIRADRCRAGFILRTYLIIIIKSMHPSIIRTHRARYAISNIFNRPRVTINIL
jgi:hypothetical protein